LLISKSLPKCKRVENASGIVRRQ